MKGMSTSGLTRAIILFLETQSIEADRNNTVGIFDIRKAAAVIYSWLKSHAPMTMQSIEKGLRACYRTSHDRKGKPDICGHHKRLGIAVYVEVKTGRDKLSPEQLYYLQSARAAGCIAIEARDYEGFVLEYERQFNQVFEGLKHKLKEAVFL